MKKIILLLSLLLSWGLIQESKATHIKAVTMYYECVAPDTVQINVV
jgi:hypothetical protein